MKDTTPGQARDKILSDFKSLATHAQDLLHATASYSGDGVTAARERLLESLDEARDQLREAQEYAIDQTRRAMKVTDEFVHEKPWQSIAGAFLVGMLLGAISAGGRR
ncbi:MAG TPA: DUF883 family protein [Nevskiaceae bacterium]|nr:DUF883 family protein [Nevskiaceae bacterium]